MIYTIGNSHAHFFTGSPPGTHFIGTQCNKYFISVSLGPVIAYNFFNHHHLNMLDIINQLHITKNDSILLAIGEVDCRWHLPKQAQLSNRSVIDVTHECIDRFFNSHMELKARGYNVIGWGGHPTTNSGHNDNQDCPVYGDVYFRNNISREWSSYLNKKCLDHNIPFVSIIDDLIDDEGRTKMEYYIDYCHLNTDLLLDSVIEKFKKQGLL